MVMASKGQDCAKGSMVQVQVTDLQDMQNHMRETLDQGLAELQKKQGQGGIPAAPAAAAAAPRPTEFAQAAPPPDANVQTELSQQAKEAEQAEQEVLREASGGTGAGVAPVTPPQPQVATKQHKKIEIGMTVAEIEAEYGALEVTADLGAKKLYTGGGMKFTFIDGKLTDVK